MTNPAGPVDAPDPRTDADVWEALARWRAERRRFALLTVVESRGFTPRKAGARMLLDANGETAGSIGGGAIEQVVLDQARAMIPVGGSATLHRHLTQELGMCCGGEMTVFIEVLEPAPRLALFGAGYIARPLAAMAAECGFEVTVVDARPDWANAERFPRARVVCRDPEHALPALGLAAEDYVCVVTHDHALDQRLVQVLLRMPLRFLGMVGSIAKQRKFALRLRARGFGDADLARLHTPLGLDIGARTPEEIAVSALAQLVAARRGVPIETGWIPPARTRGGDPADVARAAFADPTREREAR
jgi:xanthine dehydrogenase accessory factor